VSAATIARTVLLGNDDLDLARLPRVGGLAWLHGANGLLGWGEYARFEVGGPDRFSRAAAWWRGLCADLLIDGPRGPVAFGSFAFSEADISVLIVPEVVIARRDGQVWMTTVGAAPAVRAADPVTAPTSIAWSDGDVSGPEFVAAVAEAVRRIRGGEASKVVLARDLVALADEPVDPRHLLGRLADRFPDCWTFAVDGLVGATPELLLERTGDVVHSRVLAGTAWRHATTDADDAIAASLLTSAKDRGEHDFAARSVAELLHPYCSTLEVPVTPAVLRLPNVMHLATDVVGRLASPISSLELAGALHPTAAVCGTPTQVAQRMIEEIEGVDRGRYSGPVGWIGADGDGEWGIALRCAQVDARTVRLFAGCGIVADSDPETELAEAQAKLVAVRDALEPS
jgi:menaquinone-specific isochorismate synthase